MDADDAPLTVVVERAGAHPAGKLVTLEPHDQLALLVGGEPRLSDLLGGRPVRDAAQIGEANTAQWLSVLRQPGEPLGYRSIVAVQGGPGQVLVDPPASEPQAAQTEKPQKAAACGAHE